MKIADLFRPKHKRSDAGVRESAVREIADENLLKEIALSDDSGSVRHAAIERINDTQFLIQNYERISDSCEMVSRSIIDRVDAIDDIVAIFHDDQSTAGKQYSILKMAEHVDVLRELYNSEDDDDIKDSIIEQLHEPADLVAILGREPNPDLRRTAINNLKDGDQLKSLWSSEKDVWCRIAILDQLENDRPAIRDLIDGSEILSRCFARDLIDEIDNRSPRDFDSVKKIRDDLERGYAQKAVEKALKEIDKTPDYFLFYFDAKRAYIAMGQVEEAEKILLRGLNTCKLKSYLWSVNHGRWRR